MANGIIARGHLSYSATATSSEVDKPPSNVRSMNIAQVWRSVGTTSQTITLDFGASFTPGIFQIENVNCQHVAVTTSNAADFSTGNTSHGTFLMALDERMEDPSFWRRHGTHPFTTVVTHRYFRFTPSLVVDDTAFQIGRILVWPSSGMETLLRNPATWDWRIIPAARITELVDGGFETNLLNVYPRIEYTLDGSPWVERDFSNRTVRAQLQRILGAGFGQPFLLYENMFPFEERGYLVARVTPAGLRESFATYDGPLQLREVI